jgi:hypothetical protein
MRDCNQERFDNRSDFSNVSFFKMVVCRLLTSFRSKLFRKQ